MKDKWKNGYLIDDFGGATYKLPDDQEDKWFLAFCQCGHCGKEYYMPVILAVRCQDLQSAKVLLENCGRVKKGRKGVIMDVFEATETEAHYVLDANFNHDPYLRFEYFDGFDGRNEHVRSRRVIHKDIAQEMMADVNHKKYRDTHIKTRDEYVNLSNSFESNFAPIRQNGKIIFPDVDRNKAMLDFYRTTFRRYGIKKGDVRMLTYYYMLFGKDEKFGLRVDGDYICYTFKNKDGEIEERKAEIPPRTLEKLRLAEAEDRIGEIKGKYDNMASNDPSRKLFEEFDYDSVSDDYVPGQIAKFNDRLNKYRKELERSGELIKADAEPMDC